MSDIVERLRLESSVLLAFGQDFSDVLLDAALEIEQLRAALRGVIRVADRATVEFDAARQVLGEFKNDE